MKKPPGITQEEFDMLLSWLDADRERAAEKYEKIRLKLIKFFVYRGCTEAEELTDETINRVTRKVRQFAKTYVGKPDPYFYGFAKKVLNEYLKKQKALKEHLKKLNSHPPPSTESSEQKEMDHKCLNKCLDELSTSDRSLILQYYEDEKQAKIDKRKMLAEQYGLTPYALRVRVHRIRMSLRKCVYKCLKEQK